MSDIQIKQIPHRGAVNSRDFNLFMDNVKTELDRVNDKVIANEASLDRRRQDDALSRPAGANGNFQRRYEEMVGLASNIENIIDTDTEQRQVFSFFDAQHIHYVVDDGVGGTTEYPVANRLQVDANYGQVLLPYNGIRSMFWSANADDETESIYTPSVESSYTEQSTVAADKIETTSVRNAVDGSSLDPYLIRAVYDLDTDVEEVKFDVTIQVPQEITREANMLTIECAPELRCAIEDIKYSANTVTPTTAIPGLPTINRNNPLYDTKPLRFLFNTINFTSLKITLTSKHWVVENGRKVFYLGLRELGLFLVDWDQTWSQPVGAVFSNNGFFIKLEIPQVDGVTPDVAYFDDITIKTSPELATAETVGQGTSTGVRVRLFEDDNLNSVAFDSVGGAFPHTMAADKSHVWLAVELDLNNTSGVIPILESLVAEYTIRT